MIDTLEHDLGVSVVVAPHDDDFVIETPTRQVFPRIRLSCGRAPGEPLVAMLLELERYAALELAEEA